MQKQVPSSRFGESGALLVTSASEVLGGVGLSEEGNRRKGIEGTQFSILLEGWSYFLLSLVSFGFS
jgi:hypothetical protein